MRSKFHGNERNSRTGLHKGDCSDSRPVSRQLNRAQKVLPWWSANLPARGAAKRLSIRGGIGYLTYLGKVKYGDHLRLLLAPRAGNSLPARPTLTQAPRRMTGYVVYHTPYSFLPKPLSCLPELHSNTCRRFLKVLDPGIGHASRHRIDQRR